MLMRGGEAHDSRMFYLVAVCEIRVTVRLNRREEWFVYHIIVFPQRRGDSVVWPHNNHHHFFFCNKTALLPVLLTIFYLQSVEVCWQRRSCKKEICVFLEAAKAPWGLQEKKRKKKKKRRFDCWSKTKHQAACLATTEHRLHGEFNLQPSEVRIHSSKPPLQASSP